MSLEIDVFDREPFLGHRKIRAERAEKIKSAGRRGKNLSRARDREAPILSPEKDCLARRKENLLPTTTTSSKRHGDFIGDQVTE